MEIDSASGRLGRSPLFRGSDSRYKKQTSGHESNWILIAEGVLRATFQKRSGSIGAVLLDFISGDSAAASGVCVP